MQRRASNPGFDTPEDADTTNCNNELHKAKATGRRGDSVNHRVDGNIF